MKKTFNEAEKAAYKAEKATELKTAWESLLIKAVAMPGIISQAYQAFHEYSLGNQMFAAMQIIDRGMEFSPIASFKAWQEKGRSVKKGEKAIKLFMPVTIKKESETDEDEKVISTFVCKPFWFTYDQTEGEAQTAPAVEIPAWDYAKALEALGITETPFNRLDGNSQGFARGQTIAISPLAVLPHKTRFHELAHVVLGHTKEAEMSDDEQTPRDIREVEAEGVAYILCSVLELPGQLESRGYIQSWLDGQSITAKSAARIFGAADKILKAGA